MADTQRTIAGLKALYPDNTTGEISPQDLRDFVESIKTGHAEIYLTTPVETDIVAQGVFQKAEGVTMLSTMPPAANWTMPASNRLRYEGTASRLAKVSCQMTVTAAGANKLFSFRLAKNGTAHAGTQVQQFLVVAAQQEHVGITGLFEVVTNDYIELFIANEIDVTDITVTAMTMHVLTSAI